MIVHAQKIENPLLTKNTEGLEFAEQVFPFIIRVLIFLGFIAFLVQFLLGGIKWINSQGDKNKIEESQKQLTYSFVGLFVVLSIFAVIKVIGAVFGVKGLENLQLLLPRL